MCHTDLPQDISHARFSHQIERVLFHASFLCEFLVRVSRASVMGFSWVVVPRRFVTGERMSDVKACMSVNSEDANYCRNVKRHVSHRLTQFTAVLMLCKQLIYMTFNNNQQIAVQTIT